MTTSDLCKLENDEALKVVPCASPNSPTDQIDIGDIEGIEGLSDIFDGSDDFLNLKDFQFDADCSQDSQFSMHPTDLIDESCREALGCDAIDNVAFSDAMLAPPTYTDPVYGVGANGEMVSVTTNPQGTAPVTPMVRSPLEPCPAGAAPPTPTLLGDTGPAAETLKQMAAQHQSLENAQYMGMHPGYGQDSYSSRFQQSNGCYLPGYGQRTYSIPQNIYGTGFTAQLPQQQQQQHHPGAMQGHPGAEVAAMGYPSASGRTLSRYADPSGLPSSIQQLENQVQSHFGAHGTPPAPQYVPTPLHHQDVHQPSAHFHLSQTQQMSVQVGGPGQHLLMAQQQQAISVGADRRSQQNMASNLTDRMRTQQPLYQAQQQQQQQAFSHYGNGMHYRTPSAGAQLPSYQSVSGANRSQCGSANPHHQNLTMNKAIDPVALERLRTDGFCGSPSGVPKQNSGYAPSDQHLLSNSLASSAMSNCQPYCQPMKRDEPYTNGLLKRGQRAQNMVVGLNGLSAMGQRTHSGADWSSMEQHRQMALPQLGADSTTMSMSSCSGPMPAYDNCGHHYGHSVGAPGQMSIAQMQMSMGSGDRSVTNQGNHIWSAVAPSMHPSSNSSHRMTLQQANLVRQHHGMGMMLPTPMHSENMSGLLHQRLPPSSSALTVRGHCYVTDRQDEPHAQTVEFMRSRNSQATECHDILPHNVIDKLSSMF